MVSLFGTLPLVVAGAAGLFLATSPARAERPPCSQPPTPPAVEVGTGPREDEREWISEAVVVLEGASETAFTPAGAPVTFRLSCPTLKAGSDSVIVYDNGMPLPYETLSLANDSVTLASGLAGGRHRLELLAQDVYGFTIEKSVVLWIGDRSMAVRVTDESGAPVAGATVVATLPDDPKVSARLVTDANGRGTFTGLPDRSFHVVATTTDNRMGARPAGVGDGLISLRVIGFRR